MAQIIPFPRFHRAQLRALLHAGAPAPGREVWGPRAAGGRGRPVAGITPAPTEQNEDPDAGR